MFLDSVVATTLSKYGKKIYGQIWYNLVLYFWLKEHGRIRGVEGGLNIIEDIETKENSTVGWRPGKAPIPIEEQDPLKAIAFAWKHITGALPIYKEDERVNRGEARIIDFSETLITNLTKTMRKAVGSAIYAAGGEDTMDGLAAILSDTNVYPTADSEQTITGINRTTAANAFWRANVLDSVEPWALSGGADGGWQKGYNLACAFDMTDQPDIILTTEAEWEKFDATLLQSQRFESPKLAEAGFRSLMYKNCAVVWDPLNTLGTCILNTEYIKLRPDTWCVDDFIIDKKHPMEDQFAARILMMWVGNMTCTQPNKQTLISNKTT